MVCRFFAWSYNVDRYMTMRLLLLAVFTLGALSTAMGRHRASPLLLGEDSLPAKTTDKAIRYGGFLGSGFAFAHGVNGDDRFGLTMVHGIVIHERFLVGGGLGVQVFDQAERHMLSLYGAFRWRVIASKVSPILGFDFGHSFYDKSRGVFEELYAAGLIIRPTLGIALKVSPRNDLRLEMSYEWCDVPYVREFEHEPGIPYYYYSPWSSGVWKYPDEEQTTRRSSALGINLQLTF